MESSKLAALTNSNMRTATSIASAACVLPTSRKRTLVRPEGTLRTGGTAQDGLALDGTGTHGSAPTRLSLRMASCSVHLAGDSILRCSPIVHRFSSADSTTSVLDIMRP